MPTKIKADKKREITKYLEEQSQSGSILPLEIERITTELKDNQYSRADIEDLIDDLENEGTIDTKKTGFEIAYPASSKEQIEEEINKYQTPDIFTTFLVGFFTYSILLNIEQFYQFISGEASYPQNAYFSGGLIGILSSYLIGTVMLNIYERVQDKSQIVQQYRHIIYSICGIGMITGSLLYFSVVYLDQVIKVNHILTIISISVIGGIPLGIHLSNRDEDAD